MKKALLSVCLFVSIASFSQTQASAFEPEATTQEIYNYITKGYITTLQQGLDIKKGYAFTELKKGTVFSGSLSGSKYQFSYRSFHKEGDMGHAIAFMIVLMKDESVSQVFCLPSYGSDTSLYANFFNDVENRLYSDQKLQLYREMSILFTIVFRAAEK